VPIDQAEAAGAPSPRLPMPWTGFTISEGNYFLGFTEKLDFFGNFGSNSFLKKNISSTQETGLYLFAYHHKSWRQKDKTIARKQRNKIRWAIIGNKFFLACFIYVCRYSESGVPLTTV
jgi:hypothetical protein